ncbi:MAG: hypothetical protein LBF27_33175 [Sphingobacterium sp.]|jgi:hypothetical protein|nr:hypothetical protein [Sphingobacterium sp.]
MKKLMIILPLFMASITKVYSQFVIGSDKAASASILKLDMPDRALKLPVLSVLSKGNGQDPVLEPANGLMFYNSNPVITENLIDGICYWTEEGQYNSFTTNKGIDEVINDSHIPLMIFSSTTGAKANVPCGAGACSGWTWTSFNPSSAEISIDSYQGWDLSNHTYTIPSTEFYVIEYNTNISNSANQGGTSSQVLYVNGTNLNSTSGRYITSTAIAYTSTMLIHQFNKGDVLDFKYVFTQNNYRLEMGNVNIYKY